MGQHKRNKGFNPYWKDNITIPKKQSIPITSDAPLQVHVEKNVKITDKTICFVGPAMDCCVDKVVKEYVPYFEKEGYQIVFTLQKGMSEIIKWTPRWVVLFRVGTNPAFGQELGIANTSRIIKHLQHLGVRVVYYIDDFLVTANQSAPIQIAAMCNAVIVATTELETLFKSISNISVPIIKVPTHIDIPVFDFLQKLDYITSIPRYKVLMTSGGRVGATLLHAMCEKANNRWQEFDDIEWIINAAGVAQMRTLINGFRNIHKTYIDWISLEDYYSLCKSVDLIINPGSKEDIAYICPPMWQDSWLNSKSAVKYTMAGAAHIPIISSPMKSYVESIKDNVSGFIVNSADEFLDKILYLKNNPEIAKKIGEVARKDVLENYDIRKRYVLYRDAIIGDIKEVDNSIGILTAKSDGGPGSFSEMLRKYTSKLTNNKYKVVDQDSPSVKHIISIAFLNQDIMRSAKKRDPNVQFIQRMDGLPFVSYLGDTTGQKPGEIQQSILKVMQDNYAIADFIVWQSQWSKDQWTSYVDTNKKSVIIHNGVDLDIFNTKGQYIPLPGDKTKIMHSNWSIFPHKRVDILFDAIKTFPDIDFYCVGNYETTDTSKTLQRFSEFTNATYYGPVKNPKQLCNIYRAVDALLFTSEHEGSPNSALEAFASGCPILYNKVCSIIPEMFGENLVFGYATVEDLEGIFEKLNDAEFILNLRKEMALKIQDFSADKMVKKYLEILK